MSLRQYFNSVSSHAVLDVVGDSVLHGLTGALSNRAKVLERAKFSAFLLANKSPTGRTADKGGLFHGAVYYVDTKRSVLRLNHRRASDDRLSFSSSFNAALVAAGLPNVQEDVPLRWLWELFGSTTRVGGMSMPSDEHTTF